MSHTVPILAIVAVSTISIACVMCSAFLLWHQRKGWGWFLVLAFLVGGSIVAVVPDDMPKKSPTTQIVQP